MSDSPAPPGCPRCSASLVPGAPACSTCGLRLVGQDAAALWSLDQELAALQHRRAELLASLAGPEPRPAPVPPPVPPVPHATPAPVPHPTPALARAPRTAEPALGSPPVLAPDPFRAPGVTASSASPGGPSDPVAPRPARRLGVQQLLLVTGAALVVAAAVGFTAYRWSTIGVLGQSVVLVAVCAAAAAGARACARRQLGASAEALAVLAVVVLLVLLGAARTLDVLGLGATDGDGYRLGALLVAVALAAAGDRRLRAPAAPAAPAVVSPPDPQGRRAPAPGPPRAFAWAAVLLTAAVPTALALAVGGELLTWAAAALALAVLSLPASRLLEARSGGLGAAGLVIGGAHLALGVLALLAVDVGAVDGPWQPFGAALEFALLAAAAAWLAIRCARPAAPPPGPLAGRPTARRTAVVVAYGGAVGALVSLAAAGGPFAMLLLALGVAVLAGLLLAVRPLLLPWPVLVAALALAGGALVSEPVVGSTEGTWWRPAAWYALAVASALAGLRRPVPVGVQGWRLRADDAPARPLEAPRAWWAAAAGAACFGGSLLAPGPLSRPAAVAAAVVAAGVLLGASALVRRAPERVLVGAWALTAVGSALSASDGPVHVAVPLGVAGIGALLRAGARDRTAWAVPSVLLLALAWWSETDLLAPVGAGVEWWSLPPAALALAVGALAWQRHPRLGSWTTIGAGLAGGLLPSALQGAVDAGLFGEAGGGWRVAAVAVVGAAVCWAGVRWGWQAPVVLGAVAALVVAVGQLGPLALLLPASLGLFAAGAVVIVLAVRIEQARRDAARALGWVRALR